MTELRAFSLWQPWASCIAASAIRPELGKHVETRSWATKHRGLLAIHAALRFKPAERRLCGEEPFKSALEAVGVSAESSMTRFG